MRERDKAFESAAWPALVVETPMRGMQVNCEVKVFPLLVKRQSEVWPEIEQRLVEWFEPSKAVSLIREKELKTLVATFAKRVVGAKKPTT